MRRHLATLLLSLCVLAAAGCGSERPQILTVTAVSPALVPATVGVSDPSITLTGTRFTPDLTVLLAGTPVPTTLVSVTAMQAQVPATLRAPGAVLPVAIRQDDGAQGAATLATTFTVQVALRR